MNTTERVLTRAIAEQAQAWFISNREHELSAEQRQEFLTWLQASPMHVREYLAVAKLAIDLRSAACSVNEPTEELIGAAWEEQEDNVVALDARAPSSGSSPQARYQLHADSFARRRRFAIAAGIGAITVAGLGWWSVTQMPAHNAYRTAHGEQRAVHLEDGSLLHLNTDSVVHVDYSKAERAVEVERGQVLFKVAKDKLRAFRVTVGATEVVAVGTEFDVRRTNDDVIVTVVEGTVAVMKLTGAQSNSSGAVGTATPVQLTAGQQARVAAGAFRSKYKAVDVRAVDVRRAVAWVQQMITFDRETLQNIAAEFNRYGATQLVIEDSRVATVRISGIFNAYDLDSFVLYLENLKGLKVHRDMNEVRISLARTATMDEESE
jgi:transmembrane sensor